MLKLNKSGSDMFKPNKSLGQHFLRDKEIIEKIAKLADKKMPIIEIGPGGGALTRNLSQISSVLAIEKDERFKNELKKIKNLEVIYSDILTFDLEKLLREKRIKNYQIFGNLPYNIEKPIIQKILKLKPAPQKAIFLIQKEVAEKLCGKKKSIFAASVESYAKARCLFSVPKTAFSPKPKVDGEVIELTNFDWPLPYGLIRQPAEEKDFLRLIKFGFSSPRKKLINNLSAGLKINRETLKKILFQAKIEKSARAEELDIEQWLKLYKILNEKTFR